MEYEIFFVVEDFVWGMKICYCVILVGEIMVGGVYLGDFFWLDV